MPPKVPMAVRSGMEITIPTSRKLMVSPAPAEKLCGPGNMPGPSRPQGHTLPGGLTHGLKPLLVEGEDALQVIPVRVHGLLREGLECAGLLLCLLRHRLHHILSGVGLGLQLLHTALEHALCEGEVARLRHDSGVGDLGVHVPQLLGLFLSRDVNVSLRSHHFLLLLLAPAQSTRCVQLARAGITWDYYLGPLAIRI